MNSFNLTDYRKLYKKFEKSKEIFPMKKILSLSITIVLLLNLAVGCDKVDQKPEIMIYEAYTAGNYFSGQHYSPYQNSYVVLYNPTSTPVKLNGWRLFSCSAGGEVLTGRSSKLSGTIAAGAFFVIQGGKAQDAFPRTIGEALPFDVDLQADSFSPERKNGIIVLSRSGKSGVITPSAKNIEDHLAYGNLINSEFKKTPPLTVKNVLRRNSLVNTFDNSVDFGLKDIVDTPANIIRYKSGLTGETVSEMTSQTGGERRAFFIPRIRIL